jgi:hypothetical protein
MREGEKKTLEVRCGGANGGRKEELAAAARDW